MDNVNLQAMFGREPDWFSTVDLSAGAPSGRPLAVAAYRMAVAVVQDLAEQLAKIDGDGDLSEGGKARKKSRAARDAAAVLSRVKAHRDRLANELAEARKATELGASNDAVNAAIWPRLPDDPNAVYILHQDAVAAGDRATVDAIERLPLAFPGRLDPDKLAEARRKRLSAENPEALSRLDAAAEASSVVEDALLAAAGHVGEVAAGLPAPNDGDKAELGPDGLPVLSPSQAAEAGLA